MIVYAGVLKTRRLEECCEGRDARERSVLGRRVRGVDSRRGPTALVRIGQAGRLVAVALNGGGGTVGDRIEE
jgi:hypothetical protein